MDWKGLKYLTEDLVTSWDIWLLLWQSSFTGSIDTMKSICTMKSNPVLNGDQPTEPKGRHIWVTSKSINTGQRSATRLNFFSYKCVQNIYVKHSLYSNHLCHCNSIHRVMDCGVEGQRLEHYVTQKFLYEISLKWGNEPKGEQEEEQHKNKNNNSINSLIFGR